MHLQNAFLLFAHLPGSIPCFHLLYLIARAVYTFCPNYYDLFYLACYSRPAKLFFFLDFVNLCSTIVSKNVGDPSVPFSRVLITGLFVYLHRSEKLCCNTYESGPLHPLEEDHQTPLDYPTCPKIQASLYTLIVQTRQLAHTHTYSLPPSVQAFVDQSIRVRDHQLPTSRSRCP